MMKSDKTCPGSLNVLGQDKLVLQSLNCGIFLTSQDMMTEGSVINYDPKFYFLLPHIDLDRAALRIRKSVLVVTVGLGPDL